MNGFLLVRKGQAIGCLVEEVFTDVEPKYSLQRMFSITQESTYEEYACQDLIKEDDEEGNEGAVLSFA